MMNGDRKEGICRLNVDGNGCDYLRILSDLETKLRNNTNPKEKIELALQGALMFYGADRAYVIEVDDELGIGVNTYITNLIYSGADPKTVQYLAGHKHSKITMDIYAKVKYNKPKELTSVVNKAFAPKKGATPNKTRNG